jgi:hypothetical protein
MATDVGEIAGELIVALRRPSDMPSFGWRNFVTVGNS